MSGKHGSARDGRDPNTPDTLLVRLAQERERREEARAISMSEQISRESTPPIPAADMEPAATTTPASRSSKTARSHLTFDQQSQESERDTPPPTTGPWEGLFLLNHNDMLEYMGKLEAHEDFLAFMVKIKLDGPMWRTTILARHQASSSNPVLHPAADGMQVSSKARAQSNSRHTNGINHQKGV